MLLQIKKLEPYFFIPILIFIYNLLNTSIESSKAVSFLLILFVMIYSWLREKVDLAVTSLIPIVLFPLFGILDLKTVTAQYSHHIIFLFLGGFMMAQGMEKWNVHKRIAHLIITAVGQKENRILLGFIAATAFLSMWISNTASTLLMIAIFHGIIKADEKDEKSTKVLKLFFISIAYAASIGGISTIIGSPPNAIMVGQLQELYQIKISFFSWMLHILPISIILLLNLYYFVKIYIKKSDLNIHSVIETNTTIQKIGYEEKWILSIFSIVFLLWLIRPLLQLESFHNIDDSSIAIFGALLMFFVPSKEGKNLLSWKDALKIPWGIIFLFGAGFAIAKAFQSLELASLVTKALSEDSINYIYFLTVIVIMTIFLTEFSSNTATASILIPLLSSIAMHYSFDIKNTAWAITIATSCAFMLPIATPPNAIIFSTGYLKVSDLVKMGFVMNIISFIVISLYFLFIS